MTELLKLYYSFWSQFTTSYPSGNVPSNSPFPYIEYPTPKLGYLGRTVDNVILYDQSTSYNRIAGVLDNIAEIIKHPGIQLDLADGGGSMILYRPDNNFYQIYALPEDEIQENIKAFVISIEFLSHVL